MSKESTYGPQFEQLVRDAGDTGISAGDIHTAIGCSRQTVYGWIQKNQAHLRTIGESGTGGTTYMWVDAASAKARRGGNGHDEGGVEIGSVFRVTRLRFVHGKVVATLTSEHAEVQAELI